MEHVNSNKATSTTATGITLLGLFPPIQNEFNVFKQINFNVVVVVAVLSRFPDGLATKLGHRSSFNWFSRLLGITGDWPKSRSTVCLALWRIVANRKSTKHRKEHLIYLSRQVSNRCIQRNGVYNSSHDRKYQSDGLIVKCTHWHTITRGRAITTTLAHLNPLIMIAWQCLKYKSDYNHSIRSGTWPLSATGFIAIGTCSL